MKNSPLSALVLFGIAGLVGGVVYLASGDSRIETEPDLVTPDTVKTPRVMMVTPHERKLANNLKRAKQELEDAKRTGRVLPSGAIKVIDADGSPMLIHPELIEGVGRYGDPLFMKAEYKRRPAVPLLREMKQPKNTKGLTMRKLPKGQTPLTMGGKRPGKKKTMDAPDEGDAGGGGGGGAKSGGGDSPGAADGPSQPSDG